MNYLTHYGVKGQKWGVRRYQNKDGTLTPAGRSRYSSPSAQEKRMAAEANWVMTSEKAYAKGKKYILDEIRYFDGLEKHDKELAKKHRDIVQKCKTLDELDSYMLVIGDHVGDIMYDYLDNIAVNLSNDELKHHGIKGMRWGIRRYQNKDGSYTAEGRERYGINNPLKNRYSKDVQRGRVDHNNPDHPDLKKGTRLYRISSKESDLGNKRLYVTYDEAKDRNYYLSGVWNPDKANVLYEQYLEPVKDLKVASLPRVSKEALSIYGNDPMKVGESFINGLVGTRLAGEPASLISAYNKWDGTPESLKGVKISGYSSSEEISKRLLELTPGPKAELLSNRKNMYDINPTLVYRDAADAVNGDPKAQKELTRRLASMGYHAQVDAGGLGSLQGGSDKKERSVKGSVYGSTSNDPIIVFDSDKYLKERAKSLAVPKGTQAMADVIARSEAYNQSYKMSQKYIENMTRLSENNVKNYTARAKAMKDSGKSISEIAKALGMSESGIKRYLYEF